MIPFDFQPRTRIVFGPRTVDQLGELAGELGPRRALVVSDHNIVTAGHTQRGLDALQRAGIEASTFCDVHENPTTKDVESGCSVARGCEPELIIGLGGGSSMDCAKGINFLYSNGGKMHDYWGVGKALGPMLPMIAIPTTAGTGSEAQSFALISDAQTHRKMACGDKKASFQIAILDPELTVTQPARITALTGIDAIAHAVESFVTKRRNSVSLSFSREAWRLLSMNFTEVMRNPRNLEARGGMQLGACFAGLAIENSMLGATHALANPLTAAFKIPHGQAIATMLPHVVRFNASMVAESYRELYEICCHEDRVPDDALAAERFAEQLQQFVADANLPTRLGQQAVDEAQLPKLAADAAQQWTGTFNPRDLTVEDLLQLYRQAM